jgi:cellulose synthase (UDP-forming)
MMEHWYIHQDDYRAFRGALSVTRNRVSVLITVEPYPTRRNRGPILEGIINGHMDSDLARLAAIAREASPQVVYLRWAHEMELSGLYPWASNRPDLYRAAFHHVVDFFRANGADNVRWVWSPAGESQAVDYYPGDSYVDVIGLTVLADQNWDAEWGLAPQSFSDILGAAERQEKWLNEAFANLAAFPALNALVYFDDVNAANSRLIYRPDWKLPPDLLSSLPAAFPPTPDVRDSKTVAGLIRLGQSDTRTQKD